jgi:hypothetical protein
VSVGVDHDTSVFAVATIEQWWEQMGKTKYPNARRALLLFLWVGSGALRRVRGRSSQVKGACGVAARVRFAPP